MYCHLYLRNGTVYVPTMGIMDKGFYRGVEPVAVVPASNTEAVCQALKAAIRRGNPSVPMLKRSEWPPPILLKYAGVKTWSAFDRGSSLWSIGENDGNYEISGYKKHPANRSSVRDPDQKIEFATGAIVDDVITRMIEILQNAARQQSN
jgi:hypothetical protein